MKPDLCSAVIRGMNYLLWLPFPQTSVWRIFSTRSWDVCLICGYLSTFGQIQRLATSLPPLFLFSELPFCSFSINCPSSMNNVTYGSGRLNTCDSNFSQICSDSEHCRCVTLPLSSCGWLWARASVFFCFVFFGCKQIPNVILGSAFNQCQRICERWHSLERCKWIHEPCKKRNLCSSPGRSDMQNKRFHWTSSKMKSLEFLKKKKKK